MRVMTQIFLCYARQDEGKVKNLYRKLSDAGFKPWMDKKDILPGEDWKSTIQRAIRHSGFFLTCLSANSIKRGFLQKEIKDALDIWQEMFDSDIYLIPVRLEDCEVPESLRDFQWVNLFEEDGWTRLVKAIQVGMERRGEITKPVVKESTVEAQAKQEQPTEVLKVEQGEVEESVRPDLEFANREAELRRLMEPINNPGAPRYVQVYAPCGLGKTYLLKRAKTEYEAAGWLCAWLDFSSHEKPRHLTSLVLRQLGEQFGAKAKGVHTCAGLAQQVMQARRQSVIFLDAVNLATGEVRRWMKTDLIPNLEERIPDPKFRPYFIAAGRHPIREWAVYSKQRFERIRLTPFNDAVVDNLLRRFTETAGYTLPDSFFQQTTEIVLFITKGHPACIKRVLQEIQDCNFAISPHELTQASAFNHTVGDSLDKEILVFHVPEEIREVFKTLCILRGYTPNLLDRLARDGWVPARERIDWDLESELQRTYLVETPDSSPLYRLEPLIRQLVALQMEYNEEDKFLKLNQTALEIFEEQIKGKDKEGNEPPDRPYDRMQVALAVEALYHQAILLRQDNADSERARSELLGKVRKYLSYRLTRESDNYWVSLLVSAIEKDIELTALVYELTGEGGLEFVLQPLYSFS